MKTFSFFTNAVLMGIAILFTANATAKTVTVDYPGSKNHRDYLEVYRTATDKQQTVFDCTAYMDSGDFIRLSSAGVLEGCQTGKTYHIVKAEGFGMDKPEIIPDSGYRDFKLYFEPIDARDKAVHWINSPGDTLFTALSVCPVRYPKGTIACRIKGKIENNGGCNRIRMFEFDKTDLRLYTGISIPVRNDRFDYTYYSDKPQLRVLTIKIDGSYYDYPLFIEEGENEFIFHYDIVEMELFRGTDSNREWQRIGNENKRLEKEMHVDELWERLYEMQDRDKVYTPEAKALYKKLDVFYEEMEKAADDMPLRDSVDRIYRQIGLLEKSGKLFVPEYRRTLEAIDSVRFEVYCQMTKELARTPSLPALFKLYRMTRMAISPGHLNEVQDYYMVYQKHFKGLWGKHPLGKYLERMIQAEMQMRVGEDYLVYKAKTLDGQTVSVNELIEGKWAVVDLWASWCGPCRVHSKHLIPVYEKYAGKGFTVIGIASETNVANALEAIRRDGYPWTQLIDLQDEMGIWQIHGIDRSGGCIYLINPDGKIVAISPTAEEIDAILEKNLMN